MRYKILALMGILAAGIFLVTFWGFVGIQAYKFCQSDKTCIEQKIEPKIIIREK